MSFFYVNATRRLIIQAPATLALRLPTTLARVAAGRFSITPRARTFSVSLRSAFAAAKVVRKTATAGKKTAKAAPKTSVAKKSTKATRAKAKPKTKAKTSAASKKKTVKTKAKAKAKKTTGRKLKKKPLTEEEKMGNDRRALKKIVLKTPHRLPDRIWPVFVAEWCKGRQGDLLERIQGASEAYKSLSTTEQEKLKAATERNKLANQVAYTTWVESFSIADIRAANRARARLTRKHKIPMRPIHDNRMPKGPRNAFTFFVASKFQSGQGKGASAAIAMKDIGHEWTSMPHSQKQAFYELSEADKLRHKKAMKSAGL